MDDYDIIIDVDASIPAGYTGPAGGLGVTVCAGRRDVRWYILGKEYQGAAGEVIFTLPHPVLAGDKKYSDSMDYVSINLLELSAVHLAAKVILDSFVQFEGTILVRTDSKTAFRWLTGQSSLGFDQDVARNLLTEIDFMHRYRNFSYRRLEKEKNRADPIAHQAAQVAVNLMNSNISTEILRKSL